MEIEASKKPSSSAIITIPYSDAELEGVDESKLVIYHWNGAAWETLATKVDAANNLLTATTTSFSPFGVGAPGNASKLIVFTDKGVYRMGSNYDRSSGGKALFPANSLPFMNITVYLAILDDDGNLIKSTSGLNLSANLRDVELYDHTASNTYHSDTISTNGNYWTETNTTFTDSNGDGIWETLIKPTSADTLGYANGTNGDGKNRTDQFNISIRVNETVNGLSSTTYVLFTRMGCGHPQTTRNFTGTNRHFDRLQHLKACVECHWGWEHKMGVHGNNTPLGDNVSTMEAIIPIDTTTYNYNLGTENATASGNYKNTGRSDICVACHNANLTGLITSRFLDLDGSANLDKNGDGILDNDRPSCSWSQGTNADGNWTVRPGCHDNGAGNTTGTLIEKVPLKNDTAYFWNWNWKQNGAGKSYAHNRTGKNVSCEVCHGNHEVKGLPNQSASKTNINEQCWSCHNISGGYLNITSNGGMSVSHNSADCNICHRNSTTTKLDAHNITRAVMGSCSDCHDVGGTAGAGRLVNFPATNNSDAVHIKLNVNANSASGYNATNFKCWTCHGDGSEPTGHPTNYKTPQNCNNNICHSVSQSKYNETMIYSHFKNASLNNNPNNITNYNITASEQCQNCHINSIVTDASNSNLSKVSHYASKTKLIDSFNCVYCHLNKDNSKDWGNATLINKDRVGTIKINREDNNITLFPGQTVYLGEGYSLKLIEISALRGDAFINILNKDVIVDQVMVRKDDPYTYEREITVDNATFKTPAVTIRINSIFTGDKDSLIKFEATRPRKIHTEKESKNSACFACHMYRYSTEKERYKVIDREAKDDGRHIIYYTSVLLDYKLENKSKIYFNDEDYVFDQLGIMGKFISVPTYQKYLEAGQRWQMADNYSLKFKASSTDRQAWLEFIIDNNTVEDRVVIAGSFFDYYTNIRYKDNTETNTTIFTTNVSSVFLGQKDFIILKDSELLSIRILKTYANTTLFGYNGSWLHPGYRFTLGKIPTSLHTPNLFDNSRDWADCVRCHDSSKNLRISQINAISSRLGKHSTLNAAAPDNAYMSDSINKACLACHTEGTEPITHSSTYITPRNCTSCHIDQNSPTYGAKKVSDEAHRFYSDCKPCHMPESHVIIKPGERISITKNNGSQAGGTEERLANRSADSEKISKPEAKEAKKTVPGADIIMLFISLTTAFYMVHKKRR